MLDDILLSVKNLVEFELKTALFYFKKEPAIIPWMWELTIISKQGWLHFIVIVVIVIVIVCLFLKFSFVQMEIDISYDLFKMSKLDSFNV